ncbi:XRE family transcriptional regulator [Lysinibacillus fusiformis]|uniref:helix-turn-helix transcriptional regulator n=1 Tax=Lysinibacillus fusiformis TaxID=28031 RepID=UPI0011BB4FDE|nr:helix-turn-helix transcriptional regulator [Lysinibacillus fusiformis]QDZ97891.1 XRE family transcriptional regulator [Lysinibacillus fusiformis]
MCNLVCAYRKMTGLTQKEMAFKLNISEGTYRSKEKGKTSFKDKEMKIFYENVKDVNPNVTINDIFFNNFKTKKDERVERYAN